MNKFRLHQYFIFLLLHAFSFVHSALLENETAAISLCSTEHHELDSALASCAQVINESWHINSEHLLQKSELKDFLLDYDFQKNKMNVRFDNHQIFNYLLGQKAQFTGHYPLRVLLVSLEQGQISTPQDKFLLDITSNLFQKCRWQTQRPNFDLSELFLKQAHFSLPLQQNLLNCVHRYQAIALVGVEMIENQQLKLSLISPDLGQQVHTHCIEKVEELRQWLESFLTPAYFITPTAFEAEVCFPRSRYQYEQIRTILRQEPSCHSYHLKELTGKSIVMRAFFYLSEFRQEQWSKKWPEVTLHQRASVPSTHF